MKINYSFSVGPPHYVVLARQFLNDDDGEDLLNGHGDPPLSYIHKKNFS